MAITAQIILVGYHPCRRSTSAKTASTDYLKAGDVLTYTLSFAAGSNGGTAQISDLLPNELLTHTYSTSAGLVVTQTGGLDYQWDAEVPSGGAILTVTAVVDPAIVTDTVLINTAIITVPMARPAAARM
ncbi:MAG: hypothetical protein V9G12_08655 [Microthrixaceae bacterium]